jgi:hypothetical protein
LLREKRWVNTTAAEIQFFGTSLFRTTLRFPDNLPRGQYHVDVYLVHDGQVKAMQTIPIMAVKSGLDAWLFDAAQRHGWLYGLAAVLLALSGGFLAHRLLRH